MNSYTSFLPLLAPYHTFAR